MRENVSITFLLFLLSMFFISCDSINGKVEVKNPLTYNGKKDKEVTVPVGFYSDSEIDFSSDKKFKLTLKNGSEKFKIKIKSEKSFNFPRHSGTINILREDINQDFDIKGPVTTDVTYGPVKEDYVSCSRNRTERVCRREDDGRGGSRRVCRDRVITEYGTQYIRYQYEYSHKEIHINISDADILLATFFSQSDSSHKNVHERGYCRLH